MRNGPIHEYTAQGQPFEVSLKPFGALLWLIIGFEVRVGTKIFHPKLERIGLNTKTEFELEVEGKRIPAEVRSLGPMWFIPTMRYAVVVDGQEIARDVQTVRRWFLNYLAWAIFYLILLLALLGAGCVAYAIHQALHGAAH